MRALSHGYVTGQLINFFTDDGNLGMVFSVSSCFFKLGVYCEIFTGKQCPYGCGYNAGADPSRESFVARP